jgi:hypothetical protein
MRRVIGIIMIVFVFVFVLPREYVIQLIHLSKIHCCVGLIIIIVKVKVPVWKIEFNGRGDPLR